LPLLGTFQTVTLSDGKGAEATETKSKLSRFVGVPADRRGADSGELGAVREAMDFKRGSTNQQIVQSIQHDTNSLVGAATLGNILALSKFLGYIARLNTQL
jgi:hypothetical protein